MRTIAVSVGFFCCLVVGAMAAAEPHHASISSGKQNDDTVYLEIDRQIREHLFAHLDQSCTESLLKSAKDSRVARLKEERSLLLKYAGKPSLDDKSRAVIKQKLEAIDVQLMNRCTTGASGAGQNK